MAGSTLPDFEFAAWGCGNGKFQTTGHIHFDGIFHYKLSIWGYRDYGNPYFLQVCT